MKIAVVGDLLVDSGRFGTAAGGAARAASLLARTGNNVQLLTVLPSDSSPSQLAAALPGVSVAAAQDLTEEMLRCLDFADAIVVADGGRGLTSNDRLRWRLGILVSSVPIVWDQHRDGSSPVPGVSAVTLSESSAAHASGIDVRGQDSASEAAGLLLRSWHPPRGRARDVFAEPFRLRLLPDWRREWRFQPASTWLPNTPESVAPTSGA
jgi:hypothetical protein